MSLAHLTAPGSGADTTGWPGAALRRPAAYIDQPTQPAAPPVTRPAQAPAGEASADLPPAGYTGRHRRAPGQDRRQHAGRTIRSHRKGAR